MSNLKGLLIDEFNVSSVDYEKALTYQQRYGGRLENILVNMGALAEDKVHLFYSAYLDLPLLSQSQEQALDEHAAAVSAVFDESHQSWLKERQFVLFNHPDAETDNASAQFFTVDPLNLEVNDWLSTHFDTFEIFLVSSNQFERLASSFLSESLDVFAGADLSSVEEEKLRELASEAPTVSLLNSLITRALREGASDMHIEPMEHNCQVRFRVDGVLHSEETLPLSMQLPLLTRIKILSGMDIAEKRRPQDGKIELKIAQKELDIRVSCLPLNVGESVVMRFLLKDALDYDMVRLGMAADVEAKIKQDLASTAGVVLLTGPTGSGKTTSLYTFLSALNSEHVKIITLEDPVEYQLEGVNQVQVRPEIGFDFAAGLRSIVRQDPDVIMVGEIRDQETARIALQSAITGHLVFSTVHTNDAASAFTRLLDLGVEEFLLNAALISIVAQRLVRTLCTCAEAMDATEQSELSAKFPLQDIANKYTQGQLSLRKPKGCEHCNHSGFKGRRAVIEYLPCDTTLQSMPKDETFLEQARKHNAAIGNRTMQEDGFLKVVQGITTIDEVMRVAG